MSTSLINLDEYKIYKKKSSDPRDDAMLTELIIHVSSVVETYCGRKFKEYATTDTVEFYRGDTDEIIVNTIPIISVTSLEVTKNAGLDWIAITENDPNLDGFLIADPEMGLICSQRQGVDFVSYPSTPYNSLKLTYKGGYTELPDDLKLAIMDMVHYYETEKYDIAKALGGAQIENPGPVLGVDFPAHIKRTLNNYKINWL